ncbi:hypothetical protein GGR42_002821 [Saonia flava]|uniref:Uncharacterized protein n=1 Tax=Saonia flava TaxID=523696 RepID=A0A846QZI7_9FLAO|nr:hypothetical protein [Saonia flava]NJB72330.1 hypothetical protein [Saonia flava]
MSYLLNHGIVPAKIPKVSQGYPFLRIGNSRSWTKPLAADVLRFARSPPMALSYRDMLYVIWFGPKDGIFPA